MAFLNKVPGCSPEPCAGHPEPRSGHPERSEGSRTSQRGGLLEGARRWLRTNSAANCIFKGILIFVLFTSALAFPVRAQEITISAAISLKEAFAEIGKSFEDGQKGTRVQFNFGASGDLVRQILAGAPVDVFASAGLREMDELEQKGLTAPGTRVNFAGNTVVLVVPKASTLRLEAFSDLTRKEVKKMAIGNPQTVPAGRYAEQVLRSLQLWDPLKDKLVFAENVRQVLDYVARGEVDAGLVYATDVSTRVRHLKKVLPAPEGSHAPVVYPIAAIKNGKDERTARAFISLVVSAEGKRILERYGFKTLADKK
jgi:molybdate transport system substrate-binding protein